MFSRMDVLGFWQKAQLTKTQEAHQAAAKIIGFKDLYLPIQAATNVPWWVIGAIDNREESFIHSGYLGNGDPLNKKTVHVPKGRGPFKNWTDGAIDAIHISGWDRLPTGGHWDIVTCLIKCEAYNGLGYAHMGHRSPYIWAGTNMQQRGKYNSDGHFDPNQWDTQLGCAAMFLALKKDFGVDLNEA